MPEVLEIPTVKLRVHFRCGNCRAETENIMFVKAAAASGEEFHLDFTMPWWCDPCKRGDTDTVRG